MPYSQRLFHDTYASQKEEAHFVEFRLLQRLSLVQLQHELAQFKGRVWSHIEAAEQDVKFLRVTLQDYAFPEIADLASDPYNSRFCTTFDQLPQLNDPLRDFLKRVLPRRLTYTKAEVVYRTDEYLSGAPPQAICPFVDKLARFVLGFVGGAALVVPTMIMSINSTQTKSLTTSVAVVLFAIALAAGLRATNAETLAATAAYAAVLVVFVGTSGH